MTVVAVIFMPIVLLYQAWNYYVFRQRVTAPPSGPAVSLAKGTVTAGGSPAPDDAIS
jgi:cytochrome d ubiquinol oxidase subunit II